MSGISSLAGFIYQIKVFMYHVLSDVSSYKIIYEGNDDVECIKQEDGYHMHKIMEGNKVRLVQVKNGKLSRTDIYKIINNWMLVDEQKSIEYVLAHSKVIEFDTKEKLIAGYVKYIISKNDVGNSANKLRSDSNASIAYNKFFDGVNLKVSYDQKINGIIDSLIRNNRLLGNNDLEKEITDLYFNTYCSDLSSEPAKHKRMEYLFSTIQKSLFNSIEKGEPYKLTFRDFNRINNMAISEVTDDRYNPVFEDFMNTKATQEMIDVIFESNKLEVEQLKIVCCNDKEIMRYLNHELFYREIREFYIGNMKGRIEDLEYIAYDNYLSVKEEAKNSRELFINTIKSQINENVINLNAISQKGCYIHLSSEEGSIDKRVSWKVGKNE